MLAADSRCLPNRETGQKATDGSSHKESQGSLPGASNKPADPLTQLADHHAICPHADPHCKHKHIEDPIRAVLHNSQKSIRQGLAAQMPAAKAKVRTKPSGPGRKFLPQLLIRILSCHSIRPNGAPETSPSSEITSIFAAAHRAFRALLKDGRKAVSKCNGKAIGNRAKEARKPQLVKASPKNFPRCPKKHPHGINQK